MSKRLSQNNCINNGLINRLVFSRFFDICGNLGNFKGKPTRKTCFSREMKHLALRIDLSKFARWHFFDVNGVFIVIS